MSRKTKNITEETTEIAEQIQGQPQLSKKDIARAMHRNAMNRLAEIQADREGLEQLREDKTHQRRILIEQRDQADDHHQAMAGEEAEAAGRVTRENSRLQIAKGTGAEAEHEAILQSLIADLDAAKSHTEAAAKVREEAYKRAELISALDTAIDEIRTQLADLDRQEREMQSLQAEQHRALGLAIYEEIKDKIEASRARKVEAQRAIEEAESEIAELRSNVTWGALDKWQDLREEFRALYGDDGRLRTDAETIIAKYIEFVETLSSHGRGIADRGRAELLRFCTVLDLNPTMLRALIAGDQGDASRRIEIAKILMAEEKQRPRRY